MTGPTAFATAGHERLAKMEVVVTQFFKSERRAQHGVRPDGFRVCLQDTTLYPSYAAAQARGEALLDLAGDNARLEEAVSGNGATMTAPTALTDGHEYWPRIDGPTLLARLETRLANVNQQAHIQFGERVKLEHDNARLRAELDAARAALEMVEWVYDGHVYDECPWCQGIHPNHKETCRRQVALGLAAPGQPGEGE